MSRLLLILSLTTLAVIAHKNHHDDDWNDSHDDDWKDRHDDDNDCGQCDTSALKGACGRDYHPNPYLQHQPMCYKPKITFYQRPENGCQIAVVKCKQGRYSQGKVSLFSSTSHHDHGDLLFQGYGEEKIIRCNKKGKWVANDVYGDSQRVRKVYCMDGEIQAPPQPNYGSVGSHGY